LAIIIGRQFRFDLSHFGFGGHPVSYLLASFLECIEAPVVERVQLSVHFDQPYWRDVTGRHRQGRKKANSRGLAKLKSIRRAERGIMFPPAVAP
jgi:hypothetical protein